MSLREVERQSNLGFGRLEIVSGFALAMTIFQPFRVIKIEITFETPYKGGDCFAAFTMTAFFHSQLNGHV